MVMCKLDLKYTFYKITARNKNERVYCWGGMVNIRIVGAQVSKSSIGKVSEVEVKS